MSDLHHIQEEFWKDSFYALKKRFDELEAERNAASEAFLRCADIMTLFETELKKLGVDTDKLYHSSK